jgi:segregation and condensation protein A
MDYQVKVNNFEGPMDLLLFFIQRDKLNIYDIPIAHITKEFLDYMKMMDMMNIDLGGEFVYMATLLMKIKAKMLLPVSDDDEEQIEDPRTPLVQCLLEYQQYKKVSEDLQEKYESHSVHYPRGQEMEYDKQNGQLHEPLHNITLFTLSSIFQELINRLPNVNPYELHEEPIHLDEQIAFLIEEIDAVKRLNFKNLIPVLKTRLRIVVTFMAILEMLRTNQVIVEQDGPFGEIILTGVTA